MSKPFSGLFNGTLGTTHLSAEQQITSYTDRGIEIPEYIQQTLTKLSQKGDYVKGSQIDFTMRDVGIMSKETGVEFARVSIENDVYLIRGDSRGTDIPNSLLRKMQTNSGTLDFHSHPHDDDCVPSLSDRSMMELLESSTGQKTSKIVTPNGRITVFNKHGIVEMGNVTDTLSDERKKALIALFGGES